jgi:hypothetical protein
MAGGDSFLWLMSGVWRFGRIPEAIGFATAFLFSHAENG